MDISKNIIAIREAKRIKQIEVANALNIDAPNYSRLEKRGMEMSLKQLSDIAVALGVTVDDILHYGEEKTQIVDNGKVKELENRIKELESIVKDKETLLQYVRNQVVDKYFTKRYEYLSFTNRLGYEKILLNEGFDKSFIDNFIDFISIREFLYFNTDNIFLEDMYYKSVLGTSIIEYYNNFCDSMRNDKTFMDKYQIVLNLVNEEHLSEKDKRTIERLRKMEIEEQEHLINKKRLSRMARHFFREEDL